MNGKVFFVITILGTLSKLGIILISFYKVLALTEANRPKICFGLDFLQGGWVGLGSF